MLRLLENKYHTHSRHAGAATTILVCLFSDFVLPHELLQQPLEPRVLALEFSEPHGARNTHAGEFVVAQIEARFEKSVLPT